jgi:hypothetical protein
MRSKGLMKNPTTTTKIDVVAAQINTNIKIMISTWNSSFAK